jgi:hypothetical protein
MLDFYLLKDDQALPKHPEQLGLEFVGGLDDETFYNLQNKGIIDNRFDFYSDFRLGTELIKQIRETILQKQLQADADVKMLTQLFDKAEKKQSGLIALGD